MHKIRIYCLVQIRRILFSYNIVNYKKISNAKSEHIVIGGSIKNKFAQNNYLQLIIFNTAGVYRTIFGV